MVEKTLTVLEANSNRLLSRTKEAEKSIRALLDSIDKDMIPLRKQCEAIVNDLSEIGNLVELCEGDYKSLKNTVLPETFRALKADLDELHEQISRTEYKDSAEYLLSLEILDDEVIDKYEEYVVACLSDVDFDALTTDECEKTYSSYVQLKRMLCAPPKERAKFIKDVSQSFPEEIISLSYTNAFKVRTRIEGEDTLDVASDKSIKSEEVKPEETQAAACNEVISEAADESPISAVVDIAEPEIVKSSSETDEEECDPDAEFERLYGASYEDLIERSGYSFELNECDEVIIDEATSKASKPFSIKKFRDEMKTLNGFEWSVLAVLFNLLCIHGIIPVAFDRETLSAIQTAYDLPENAMEQFPKLENLLYKKGYLKYATVNGYPTIISLTKKGVAALNNQKIKGLMMISTNGKASSFPIIDKNPATFFSGLLRTMSIRETVSADITTIATREWEDHDAFLQFVLPVDNEKATLVMGSAHDEDNSEKLMYYLDSIADCDIQRLIDTKRNANIHVYQVNKRNALALKDILDGMLEHAGASDFIKVLPHWYESESGSQRKADGQMSAADQTEKPKADIQLKEDKIKPISDTKEAKDKKDSKKKASLQVPVNVFADPKLSVPEKKKKETLEKAEKKAEEAKAKIEKFINEDKLYCATAYAAGLSKNKITDSAVYERLAYAVADPLAECNYTSDKLFEIYTDFDRPAEHYYQIAAILRLFFAGQSQFDYNLSAIHDSVNGNPVLANNQPLNDLLYNLRKFRKDTGFAVDRYADYRSREKVEIKNELKLNAVNAEAYYENDCVLQKKMQTKTTNRRYEETWRSIFSKESDFGVYLKAVADDNDEYLELAASFLKEIAIKDDMPVSADNIDNRKIEEYIDQEWRKAADKVSLVMKSADLMGTARNNLRQHIIKSVIAICNWVTGRELLDEGQTSGHESYLAIRSKLLDLIEGSVEIITSEAEAKADPSESAGSKVLISTLSEMKSKIKGEYDVASAKIFYKDFLTHSCVPLNEKMLPDMDCNIADIKGMRMHELAEEHANLAKATIAENLDNYCHDNYRSSRLALKYLIAYEDFGTEMLTTIDEAEKYALGQHELNHRDFIRDLELAQSYGQLDTDDMEDKKDAILLLEEDWYQWAKETGEFGFYNRLTEKIRQQIKQDAESRGNVILSELETLLNDNASLDRDHHSYVDKIRKTIEKQNYLVAEDMINHLLSGDIPHNTDLFETDYLADFLRQYDQYYRMASITGQPLGNLVKAAEIRKLSETESKNAETLVRSWPKPGKSITGENLRSMLTALGIAVEKISAFEPDGIFNVKVKKALHEDESAYGHPIYVFGSKAVREGFRVAWLSGSYNADELIAKMHEYGKGKHTLVILDHALTETDRRRLARKAKEEGSSKVFAVIDKTMYLYLIHNYSAAYISRIVMELAMPYAYFQPYIYDSASVMPPEMFIGRKSELEDIMNPSGANIVYGGRQLGKSALLRKAKADIDNNKGDRAVLVDIKDLDYKKTAVKISQTLYDEGIIDAPVKNEEDWNEIARTIKNRLNQSKDIHYLLLMLDEADRFLESCEEVGYSPFNALKDIQQSVDSERFKFVVAGLRNVVRFTKAATSGNSVLPHLKRLAVKPFTSQEAKLLLEQPLYYLGFRFPTEESDLVPMILATANYFPGLIQLYCAKLVEALKRNYADYEERETPPYIIEENLIKRVLADSDFINQIKEKFMITLRVGNDDYYYILALILAYLYRTEKRNDGYSVSDVMEMGIDLGIGTISSMSKAQIEALMTEMCELNVLKVTANSRYLFSRYNFLSMMGTLEEVEDKLLEYVE